MLSKRRNRLILISVLIVAGIGLIAFALTRPPGSGIGEEVSPMDIEWVPDGEFAYATVGEGRILRLTVDGDRVSSEVIASGLAYPRGLAVLNDTLYVAELGVLPCENPVPRCKGENVGADSVAEGERQLLEASSGRILAFPIEGDGLGEPEVILAGLHFANTDHGLNDLDVGPDGNLYLSVGNLDRLAWDDGGDPPSSDYTRNMGAVLRIDPLSGILVDRFATGLRNVFGLSFDADGTLWGVDNDGRGHDIWRAEELLRIEEGLDYGFPEDGTVGPYTRRTGFAAWIMPTGAGSSGITVTDEAVISGACGRVTRVEVNTYIGGDAVERVVPREGCMTAIEPIGDGRYLVGTVFGGDPFTVTTEESLFGSGL